MFSKKLLSSIEPLESRIAPAALVSSAKFIAAPTGSPIIMHAGEVLTTAGSVDIQGVGIVGAGTYLLYVEKGDAVIYTTDRNNNGVVDFNEITGIAAGAGLRLTSFVDIYGDIVTNLNPNLTLTDSDNNSANGRDGRVVLNSTIEKIELRSLTDNDVVDENGDGDTLLEVSTRLALSSYSIHGNIYAGQGFGVVRGGVADGGSGLIIDDTGRALQDLVFNTPLGLDFYAEGRTPLKPSIGFIRTGSAVSGEWFTFGTSKAKDISGYISSFQSPAGQHGGNIAGINLLGVPFNIAGLVAGEGGTGAAGGNIIDVTFNGDDAGGYIVQAGNGGRGPTGGTGGSVTNFQDLNSVTAKIVIQSGDGGVATTGAGGNGGEILLGTMNVNGGLGITMGSGGDGFTSGGLGASLTRAVVTTPEGVVQFGTENVGTTHQGSVDPVTHKLLPDNYGVIGRHNGIDFNHDGFGDTVIASTAPNSLTVVLGDGLGDYLIDPGIPGVVVPATTANYYRIELDAPVNPEAVVVADLNQDGFVDIAAASSAPGNFGGIYVFLAKSEDANDDGILTAAEDLNHNGVNDFVGFRTARQSFLPSLANGDPDEPLLFLSYIYKRSAVPIVSITAGDFDGDGYTDLAVSATYIVASALLPDHQVLMFLKSNIENGRPTGEFFADVGDKAIGEPRIPANPFVPFFDLGGGSKGVVHATALRISDTYDSVGAAVVGGDRIRVLDNPVPSLLGPGIIATVTNLPGGWGSVDTDRLLGPNHVNLTAASVRNFAILDSGGEQYTDANTNGAYDPGEVYVDNNGNGQFDPEQDGIADVSLITESPAGFVLSMISSGANNLFNVRVHNPNTDNAGTWMNGLGFGYGGAEAIRDVDGNGDGTFNEVAVLSYPGSPTRYYAVVQLNIANVPPPGIVANPGATVGGAFLSLYGVAPDVGIVAFDAFIPDLAQPEITQYVTALPTLNPLQFHLVEVRGDPVGFFPPLGIPNLSERYIQINAGNGGDGLVGFGGDAGSIGGGNIADINLTLPGNLAYEGVVSLVGGKGGNGFSTGGDGGVVAGVELRGSDFGGSFTAELYGGDGGFGVGGNAGNGGSLFANSIERGSLFQAGNGGRGRAGGNGGDIIGNRVGGDYYDTQRLIQDLVSGVGGDGVTAGGHGGNIVDFHGDFSGESIGSVVGYLSYVAGNGGTAISGPGGAGGSIVRSSPFTIEAHLGGDILLQAGDGGDGRSGGNGGGITRFSFKPSDTDNPAVLSVLAGNGGKGVSGLGGAGGSVADINIPTVGKPNPIGIPLTPYTFDRILAGNGGASAGSIGGAGGSLLNIATLNSDGPFVLSAGAGGDGLTRGGVGGSVKNTELSVGGESFAKALIVAGAGGNATAFIPNRNDSSIVNQTEKAFGGIIGRGGNGGSIENFQQNGASKARVDLIAGDGGSTLNYGTASDARVPVGIGGTIKGISIAGTIGNVSPTVPIKSYNNIFNHETVADFLDRNLRAVGNPFFPIDGSVFADSVGVEGLVVGSAGRLKEVQTGYERISADPTADGRPVYRSVPAFLGVNGGAIDISAGGIMSMVAGNVERIASIQTVSGIQLTSGGVLGTDKGTLGISEYLDKDGNPILEPFLDGRLLDGALIYKSFVPLFAGDILPNNPRIFKLG